MRSGEKRRWLSAASLIVWLVLLHSSSQSCQVALQSKQRFYEIQKPGLIQSSEFKERADEIKQVFQKSFKEYLKYGYPADEALPVSLGQKNGRNGWGATLVDSLTTLYVMELVDEFNDALEKTLEIDFKVSRVDEEVVLFETVIRYLASLLSIYELTGEKNKELLNLAKGLGDRLIEIAWQDKDQKIPYGRLNFTSNLPTSEIISSTAAGSLIIEFDRLSYFTGDTKYIKLVERTQKVLMTTSSVFPGLPGFTWSSKNSSIVNNYVTWGGGIDSYLEYLLKYGMLINNKDDSYLNTWKLAVESSIKNLIKISPIYNLTYLSDFGSNKIDFTFSHLACFSGGNWIIGGKVLKDPKFFELGLSLIDTCMKIYESTETGIGPEIFQFLGPDNQTSAEPMTETEREFYDKNGFYIIEPKYILRPEVIESTFIAYRLTGDLKYSKFIWNVFESLKKFCKSDISFSSIDSVDSKSPIKTDRTESFFYAETLKYIYLTFASPDIWSLDEYIFNTEAHPFKINNH